MELVNLLIGVGASGEARAAAISSGILEIEKPIKEPDDVATYRFGWIVHPTNGMVALQADLDVEIKVHPDKNLDNLTALMGGITEAERLKLAGKINNAEKITLAEILPTNTIYVTEAQLENDGWNV